MPKYPNDVIELLDDNLNQLKEDCDNYTPHVMKLTICQITKSAIGEKEFILELFKHKKYQPLAVRYMEHIWLVAEYKTALAKAYGIKSYNHCTAEELEQAKKQYWQQFK